MISYRIFKEGCGFNSKNMTQLKAGECPYDLVGGSNESFSYYLTFFKQATGVSFDGKQLSNHAAQG
jgi:hypothetical protein